MDGPITGEYSTCLNVAVRHGRVRVKVSESCQSAQDEGD